VASGRLHATDRTGYDAIVDKRRQRQYTRPQVCRGAIDESEPRSGAETGGTQTTAGACAGRAALWQQQVEHESGHADQLCRPSDTQASRAPAGLWTSSPGVPEPLAAPRPALRPKPPPRV
jgi:hypothetical protein